MSASHDPNLTMLAANRAEPKSLPPAAHHESGRSDHVTVST